MRYHSILSVGAIFSLLQSVAVTDFVPMRTVIRYMRTAIKGCSLFSSLSNNVHVLSDSVRYYNMIGHCQNMVQQEIIAGSNATSGFQMRRSFSQCGRQVYHCSEMNQYQSHSYFDDSQTKRMERHQYCTNQTYF
jgi:hypothetical protein